MTTTRILSVRTALHRRRGMDGQLDAG
jgi:hypothetical protein